MNFGVTKNKTLNDQIAELRILSLLNRTNLVPKNKGNVFQIGKD